MQPKVVKCPNNHFYDSNRYADCPHCNPGIQPNVQAEPQPAPAPTYAEPQIPAAPQPVPDFIQSRPEVGTYAQPQPEANNVPAADDDFPKTVAVWGSDDQTPAPAAPYTPEAGFVQPAPAYNEPAAAYETPISAEQNNAPAASEDFPKTAAIWGAENEAPASDAIPATGFDKPADAAVSDAAKPENQEVNANKDVNLNTNAETSTAPEASEKQDVPAKKEENQEKQENTQEPKAASSAPAPAPEAPGVNAPAYGAPQFEMSPAPAYAAPATPAYAAPAAPAYQQPYSPMPAAPAYQQQPYSPMPAAPAYQQPPTAPAAPAYQTPAAPASMPAQPSLGQQIGDVAMTADSKTIGIYGFDSVEPCVGFLICIKGENYGESFKLKTGRNSIGRSVTNDVALTDEDTVSREKQAIIIHDPEDENFYLQPGENATKNSYLNGKIVIAPAPLSAYDVVKLGECELVFLPLCGEKFSWKNHAKA